MKKIKVGKNHFAIIDDEDFESISKFKWSLHSEGYAYRGIYIGAKRVGSIFMHRQLLGKSKLDIDHINRNPLDNRRSNLRLVTRSQNMFNYDKPVNNTSGYRGVYWHKQRNKWNAKIKYLGINYHLGLFDHILEAIKARKDAEVRFGVFI